MGRFFGQTPTVTPPCLPYWPIGENFARKVRTKLNQLRKRHPGIPPANLGGIEAALEILHGRTERGGWGPLWAAVRSSAYTLTMAL